MISVSQINDCARYTSNIYSYRHLYGLGFLVELSTLL